LKLYQFLYAERNYDLNDVVLLSALKLNYFLYAEKTGPML
jgi:hypothetical protein